MHILYLYTDPTNPESNELLTGRRFGALYADSTAKRPGLQALLQNVSQGDIVYIPSATHLAEDAWPAIQVLQQLAHKGADVVLVEHDTLVPVAESPYVHITEQMVKALRRFRNVFTQRRARQGTRRALKRGVRMGRPTKALPDGFVEAARKWGNGETTAMLASASIGMPFSTFVKKAHIFLKDKH